MRSGFRAGSAALALSLGACAFFAEGPAEAFEFGTPVQQHPYRSPQNFALELRFSPYYPDVDKAPGLSGTPFRNDFGDKSRLYFGLEFDWQLFRIPYVGTIGPGLGAGIVGMSRDAVIKSTGKPSADEYSLDIYPFYLSAVLRADTFWHDAGIPIVPYGKLGFGYGLWRASNSLGTAEANGVKGKGASAGTHIAIGAAFALNALDQGASRNMDNEVGINNTYFYAEYYWLNLSNFGSANALYVGASSWALGLAFEF